MKKGLSCELTNDSAGWIPVAERIQERNKSVLLCMKSRSSRTGMCIQTVIYADKVLNAL